jgi:AAA family ATP:ADP antiporter
MAVQFGAHRLQWLFSATFLFTLTVVPLFGWVVRSVSRTLLVPVVYGFLVVNLLGFHAAFTVGALPYTAAAFFVWLSVFNLFVVSLFWSRLGDCFTTEESHRLYAYVAAGGTCGALAGPALTATLARHVETGHFLLLSMALLSAALLCLMLLRQGTHAGGQGRRPIGGSVIAGIPLALRKPDLRGIALLVICYTTVSTVLYIELVAQVGLHYASPGERTAFFARVDLSVNALALLLQLLGTRRIIGRFGLKTALAVVPLVMLGSLAAITAWRSAIALAAAQTVHRAGEYALGKPGREMIYTTVDPESRYKAKNFIDTAVYRASDAASAWGIAALRAAGMDAVLFAALPVACIWLINGFRLGARHDRHEST